MANYFIERPVFAWVLAIILMLAGGIAIMNLPVAQYPQIAPPTITVSATYPGADAQTVEDSVTQVIEQNMTGLDGLMYMSSTSDAAGNAQITLTFETGTSADIAQVQVQNKLQLAMPSLPQEVQQQGISVDKSSSNILMVAAFISDDGSLNQYDIADYVASNIKDPLSRTAGVGSVQLFGSQYAMRIWLDPQKLNKYNLEPQDVISQIKIQNNQISGGQLGGMPQAADQQLNASIIVQTRLQSPEEFGKILLKVQQDGSQVLLRDVARVELGAEDYSTVARYNGKPAAGIAIKLATGANALDTSKAVKSELDRLSAWFPASLKTVYPYDTTPFIQISIQEVFKTLIEAIILVFLVMYLFLQNFRATLIPTIAVPVVILGTFAILSAVGFTINTLTMFGMVLAIGLLVDDAIVVVENVERVISEEGLAPKEAAHKSMGQIQRALVGIAVVLSAVFMPMAFMSGATGEIYRQFSITLISSMLLSVFVAMSLTPALCATLLKPTKEVTTGNSLFARFNRLFEASTNHYTDSTRRLLGTTGRYMVVYLLIVAGMAVLFLRTPTSFLPEEDQGVLMTTAQLPSGSTMVNTSKVLDEITDYYLTKEKNNVESVFTVGGFGFSGQGQNNGLAFISLKPWSERVGEENSVTGIIQRAMVALSAINKAVVFPFNLPAVAELGTASGFDMELLDNGNLGHEKLTQARNELLAMAAQAPDQVTGVRPNGLEDTPMFRVNVNAAKAEAMGVSLSDINQTISTAFGSSYVNDFLNQGRVKKVYVQAGTPFRMLPDNINQWYVRNASGTMAPLSAYSSTEWTYGSPRLERYNGLPSMEILGEAAAGKSTGEAMDFMASLVAKLPAGVGYSWTGLSYQEKLSTNQAPMLYAISLIVVFLALAALYESWSIPFSVMLVVPLGVIGALLATDLRGLSNDVYFQVGLLTTIGLAAKNAILIVEFAVEMMQKEGKSPVEAIIEAARMRLRPILMTSLAFILGVLPLVISHGAGSGAQNAVGTGVMGGMFAATVLAIYFVPVFFIVVEHLFSRFKKRT
ncbi:MULTISPECIES: efflux RND transporter permease subunit [Escherichia]|uniref:efflux RND transporter permease subunit n=1 Tax=Escherichia TaxID=561 RepID=UPI0002057FCF|nr:MULTISPECIES: efflux RND transporter permease subunit [Escherichia]EGC96510.1 multidrug transporter, RpoS-dependent [Escherichia fergusonii ECD227]EGO8191469.1 multidrug efflux RND transporter permease subunit [Escherichia fergusonii]EHG5998441.1 multidrug efflux RND transporter permease subunit [Escherichia fergusonii]EHJ4102541.1 multidrug efflux RND transporter permease subunit [Escherichia fergusonii]EJM2215154.1 multidrug efflux RND transporter permease subunit [Escherichia fergusonii]